MQTFRALLVPPAALLLLFAVVGCKPAASKNDAQSPPAVTSNVANREWDATAKEKVHELGTFAVESGNLIVSDPCYQPPKATAKNTINGLLSNAKLGTWKAEVSKIDAGEWGRRCAELRVHHQDHPSAAADQWLTATFIIGVDAGQAGVFDQRVYGNDATIPKDFFAMEQPLVPETMWYSMCCQHTLSELSAGVVPGGAVSSSGYGDGAYECFYRVNNAAEVVGVTIVFLTKKEMEEPAP